MPNITPVWTDSVAVAIASLARNTVSRTLVDLRTKLEAYLHCRVGRTGTASLTNGVAIRITRRLDNTNIVHPASYTPLLGLAAGAASTTVNADSNAGQDLLNVASTTGIVVDDFILIQDSGGGFTRAEWAQVAQVVSATQLRLVSNLQFTHTAVQADTVRNKADVYPPIWLPGGAQYEIAFDYGDDAAGDSVVIHARIQTHDSDQF